MGSNPILVYKAFLFSVELGSALEREPLSLAMVLLCVGELPKLFFRDSDFIRSYSLISSILSSNRVGGRRIMISEEFAKPQFSRWEVFWVCADFEMLVVLVIEICVHCICMGVVNQLIGISTAKREHL